MGPAEKRAAEAVRRFGGEPQPCVVALRKGPFLAGDRQFPAVRQRMSGLRGAGCPYCTGRKVVHPGFNDLASKAPAVAAQWHPVLSGGLTPEMVTVSSHRRVWRQCPQGHVWKALVYSRTGEQKCGCPVCGGSLGGARRARYEQALRETAGVCDTGAPP